MHTHFVRTYRTDLACAHRRNHLPLWCAPAFGLAFAEAARLPEDEQESLASIMLEEMEAERGWDERFANSQQELGELVRRAREEVVRGDVLPFDPSNRPPQ